MLIAVLMMASCGNKFSLTKRHYQKGYYFARNGSPVKPNAHAKEKNNKTLVVADAKQEVIENAKKTENIRTFNTGNKQDKVALVPKTKTIKPKKVFAHVSKTKTSLEQDQLYKDNIQRPAKSFGLSASNNQLTESSSDEGRSLFWIVIVVLVILWALGYISGGLGLGILINLLLLVALILLILWLFRIL